MTESETCHLFFGISSKFSILSFNMKHVDKLMIAIKS
jgi:hypothetical protein